MMKQKIYSQYKLKKASNKIFSYGSNFADKSCIKKMHISQEQNCIYVGTLNFAFFFFFTIQKAWSKFKTMTSKWWLTGMIRPMKNG